MNLTAEQFAELLVGITRSQQAIIDAIESDNGGWRNTHLLPKLNTASNMRLATPRLIDVPSRVLLRSQGRVPYNAADIARLLHEAVSGVPPAPGGPPVAAETVSPVAAAPTAAPAAVAAPARPASDDLSNFFDS